MKTLNALMLAAALCTGCGGDGPTGPSPLPPSTPLPPTPSTITVTGHLTATNGGHPLADVQAALGASNSTTDGSGTFSAAVQPLGSLLLSLSGSGIIPRTLRVAATSSRELAVDAISLGGAFDLNFYRQLVRDAMETTTLQPLRRWTTSPNLYLQTGSLADARTLAMVEQVARAAVPQWTGGRLNIATVERGPDSRAGQPGWLTVLFSAETTRCGLADVGKSGGTITLYPRTQYCGCSVYPIRPTTVRHEFGHAMGFYHTDNVNDVMNLVANQCDTPLSAREAYHAAIAYSRPEGNQDPDTDPATTVNLAPMRKF